MPCPSHMRFGQCDCKVQAETNPESLADPCGTPGSECRDGGLWRAMGTEATFGRVDGTC